MGLPKDRAAAEPVVVTELRQKNGQCVRLTLHPASRGVPPCVRLALVTPRSDGSVTFDDFRALRFFPDELAPLAHGFVRALEEAAKHGWFRSEPEEATHQEGRGR
jgi:hypothetical protein